VDRAQRLAKSSFFTHAFYETRLVVFAYELNTRRCSRSPRSGSTVEDSIPASDRYPLPHLERLLAPNAKRAS
jgi:hypothetical protein